MYVNHVTCTAYRMNSRLSIKGTFLQGKEGSVILNFSRGPVFISRFSEQDESYCKMFLLYIYRVVDTLIRSRSERWAAVYVSSTCCPRGSRSHDPACVADASYPLGYTGRNLKQGFFIFRWCSCQPVSSHFSDQNFPFLTQSKLHTETQRAESGIFAGQTDVWSIWKTFLHTSAISWAFNYLRESSLGRRLWVTLEIGQLTR